MSNILSVSVSSSFSASPIDAAASAQEELDPRFVEELQGAMGRQEPPGAPQAASETPPSPDPLDPINEATSGLQNLPLMPWVAVPMPANFALSTSVSSDSAGDSLAIEGLVGQNAPALTLSTSQTQASVTALATFSEAGMATSDPTPSGEAATAPPTASVLSEMQTGTQPSVSSVASNPSMTATDGTELMALNPATVVTGGSMAAVADRAVERASALNLDGAGISDVASPLQAKPAGELALDATAVLQARDETQPALDLTAPTVLQHRPVETLDRTLQAQPNGMVLPAAQAQEATQSQQSSEHRGITASDGVSTSDSISMALSSTMFADNDAATLQNSVLSSKTQTPPSADVSRDIASVGIAQMQELQVEERADATYSFMAQAVRADSSPLSATSTAKPQVPAVATSTQVITASTHTSSIEVTAQVLANPVGEPTRMSSRRDDAGEETDPLAQNNVGAAEKVAALTTESAGVTDPTVSRPTAPSSVDESTAVTMQASAAVARGQSRLDQAMIEDPAKTAPATGSTDAALTRMVSPAVLDTQRVGTSETSTPGLSSAESTFASSFVQALMGQVHHGSAQHSQPLEVLPPPAPMAPHQVRLDAGQVQVEVVRLVKQGGGQVVMELTPPDESKFKIDLSISQQGVARLVVDGASESTRLRLEQTVSGLQDQFQQMGLQLQLDMRQPHQQEARSQSSSMTPENAGNGPLVSAPVAEEVPSMNARPTWEHGQVYLVA